MTLQEHLVVSDVNNEKGLFYGTESSKPNIMKV